MDSSSQSHSPSSDAASPEDLVSIAGPLTVASVESWRVRIVDAITRSPQPGVDLAALDDVDVFGLQLLYAARRGAEALGKRFRVLNGSPLILRACVSAGVDPLAVGLCSPSEIP
jgi:hypothetical protein